jgi:hypothetical protein
VWCNPFCWQAGLTRLELATSDVTGRRSNQLNYSPAGERSDKPAVTMAHHNDHTALCLDTLPNDLVQSLRGRRNRT